MQLAPNAPPVHVVSSATISGPGADIERIRQAMEDLAAAGNIEGMKVTDRSETLQVEAELAPVE